MHHSWQKHSNITIQILQLILFQSDEDESNFDEVRSAIEQSILSSSLAKLGIKQSGDRAEGEQATPLEDRVNCETIHKKFNRTSCYLCEHGYSSNKKEERKKSNLKSCPLFAVKEKRKLIYHSSLYQTPRAVNNFRLLSVCH